MQRFALFILFAATLLAADFAAEGNLWWAHVQFLADDKLEGRQAGSEGYRKAVEYVQTAFERLGLKPAGMQVVGMVGLFQTVRRTFTWALRLMFGKIERHAVPPAPSIRIRSACATTAPNATVQMGIHAGALK